MFITHQERIQNRVYQIAYTTIEQIMLILIIINHWRKQHIHTRSFVCVNTEFILAVCIKSYKNICLRFVFVWKIQLESYKADKSHVRLALVCLTYVYVLIYDHKRFISWNFVMFNIKEHICCICIMFEK